MQSSLFSQIVFGPIHSRRLGTSLGVNLLPAFGKWCNFNCIYCECGWNDHASGDRHLPLQQEVVQALEKKLVELAHTMDLPDVITFSGNGEPTLHPHFKPIIKETLALRNQYAPNAKVCVLSNATQLNHYDVFEALTLVDKPILKIDSAFPETLQKINQPVGNYNLDRIIVEMKRFHRNFALQTLFLRGFYNGSHIDNTTQSELKAWLDLVMELKPIEVMIYTIDRKTPAQEIEKVSVDELEEIGERIKLISTDIQVNIAG